MRRVFAFIFSQRLAKSVFTSGRLVLVVAGAILLGSGLVAQTSTSPHKSQDSIWNALSGKSPVRDASTKAPVGDTTTDKHVAFDVVSIRRDKPDGAGYVKWGLPDGFQAKKQSLLTAIMLAYFPREWIVSGSWPETRILGAPSWVKEEQYDIEAKVAHEDIDDWQHQGPQKNMMRDMLKTALADRCKLRVHSEEAEKPAYALVIAKHGTRLKNSSPDELRPKGIVSLPGGGKVIPYRRGEAPTVTFFDISMPEFAAYISGSSDRPVVDKTGLAGTYHFLLSKNDTTGELASDPDAMSLWNLEELGLKLVPIKAPMETLVIDHIERPSAN